MKPLFVIGAGGHAKVVISAARAAGWHVVGVLDSNASRWGQEFCGTRIRGSDEGLQAEETPAVIAIGDNVARERIAERHAQQLWATIVHPRAWVDPTATVGPGTVVFAGAIVQPDCTIGAHVIVNTGASIDHECRVQDFSQVAPGAHLGGNTVLGHGSFVGIGASLHQGAEVGDRAVLGGGSFLKGRLAPDCMAVGVPARVIKSLR